MMYVLCKGNEEGEEYVKTYRFTKRQMTLGNLSTMKSKLRYRFRAYLYYKQRIADAPGEATLNEIEFDVDVTNMLRSYEEERELRLVLSPNAIADPCGAITPHKSRRVSSENEEEEEVDEYALDAYKDWLAYMHARDQAMGELC